MLDSEGLIALNLVKNIAIKVSHSNSSEIIACGNNKKAFNRVTCKT